MNPNKLKAFMLPQSTHDAILEAGRKHPNLRPSEIIEMALHSLSEKAKDHE